MNFLKTIFLLMLLSLGMNSIVLSQAFDGYALYNGLGENRSYLIDKNGDIAHVWNCNLRGNYTVLLKDNGNIVRGANPGDNQINGAAVGGMVQELDSNANVVWEFRYSNADHVSHHDITLLPNGNVLLTAWEVKGQADLQAMGFTGNDNQKYPTHIIEVQQNGSGGQIVWEWHIWDHLIQDVDSLKPNFGVISEHPELMNINVSSSGRPGGDWFHVNGIDYNAELDQIAFTSRYMSEIFIIDHSTTTAEAASHTGGNAGKGGDFLFRWGNPLNFGALNNRNIAQAVHDVRWIDSSAHHKYGGYLQFFNNSGGPGNSSIVNAILPPLSADGYNYDFTPGIGYGPGMPDWEHSCRTSSSGQSASNRLPNGNVFVNVSRGYMYEVDSLDNLIWQYNEGPAKAFRYTCDHPGIIDLLNDPCDVIGTAVNDKLDDVNLQIYPNPSNDIFYIQLDRLSPKHKLQSITVTDIQGRILADISTSERKIDLSSQSTGMYFVSLDFGEAGKLRRKVSLK